MIRKIWGKYNHPKLNLIDTHSDSMKRVYLILLSASLTILCFLGGLFFNYDNSKIQFGINLCSSFIGTVGYDSDPQLCKIPCDVGNKYKIVDKPDKADCPKVKPAITIENNTIYAQVNTEVVQYVRDTKKYKLKTDLLHKGDSIKLESETIRTNSSYSKYKYDWFIKFIPKPIKNIIKRDKLSVHLILTDAASRFVARKQLPKTIKTLRQLSHNYSTYDMLRYHTIAANSNPHYPTLFYGVNETEGKSIHKLILEEFKEEGYMTINNALFVDPEEKLTSNNNYSGSDHYINYLCEDRVYNNVGGEGQYGHHPRCVGHQQIHKYSFDYLKESVKYYHSMKQPTLALSIFLESHDYWLVSLPRIDEDLSNYINFLHKSKILNDSILILFSDHGIHYGSYKQTYFGTLDHSLPLMFFIFPKWFIEQHPEINKNMLDNQNRFITGYDFHSTLFDIAHFGSNKKNYQNKRGISLFNPIPKSRNCREFNVVFGCSCNMSNNYYNVPQYT